MNIQVKNTRFKYVYTDAKWINVCDYTYYSVSGLRIRNVYADKVILRSVYV